MRDGYDAKNCPFTRAGANSQYGVCDYAFCLTSKDMLRFS